MLEKEEPLPGAQSHAAIHDGDDFADAREDHFNVRGHLIGALIGPLSRGPDRKTGGMVGHGGGPCRPMAHLFKSYFAAER
jgi:hypothetical protein